MVPGDHRYKKEEKGEELTGQPLPLQTLVDSHLADEGEPICFPEAHKLSSVYSGIYFVLCLNVLIITLKPWLLKGAIQIKIIVVIGFDLHLNQDGTRTPDSGP